jgi:hypothetical protein
LLGAKLNPIAGIFFKEERFDFKPLEMSSLRYPERKSDNFEGTQ